MSKYGKFIRANYKEKIQYRSNFGASMKQGIPSYEWNESLIKTN